MKRKIVSMVLCTCMILGMVGCSGKEYDSVRQEEQEQVQEEQKDEQKKTSQIEQENATIQKISGVQKTIELTETVPEPDFTIAYTQELPLNPVARFGWELLQETNNKQSESENILLSPMSAFISLQMTALGAEGKTKEEMTEVLHTGLNDYVHEFAVNLPEGAGCEIHMANSIWFKDTCEIEVKKEFLQWGKEAFGAQIFKAPFDDSTLQDINAWVKKNTDDKIENILDEISEDAVLYLINALSFDAEWEKIYNETEVWKDVFTKEDGTERLVSMLHSDENTYLENESVTGFVKYYKDRKYAFVALLPKEGKTVNECIDELSGERIAELIRQASNTKTEVTIPKFSVEYSVLLNEMLIEMGMTEAFHEEWADFDAMADSKGGNIFISRVLQKTFLSVDERGTLAGAATVTEMANKMALLHKKKVELTRPFIYMVVECEYNEPLFLGTMMDVGE